MPADNNVGPYRILRLINRGGQGSVYLGYDRRLRRRVAIKIHSLPAQRTARRRLLSEARLVAAIHSSKVVQVHDLIESREHLALVMEYVPGCDLEEFLAVQRPSLASVLTIGADIAGALAAARAQHIVHGDLKAGNVLISDAGRAKLTDFGIARRSAGTRSRQLTAGSHSALSPEQYHGLALDVRADLFALGCLLYRMLTGVQPFFRGGGLDIGLLLECSPRPVRELVANELELPPALEELVNELLQKDPQDRPENTLRVRQVLRNLSRDIPLAACDSLLQQARPCFRRESPEDIPPLVPPDLGRDGRSRLTANGIGETPFAYRLARLGWSSRIAVGLLAAVLLGIPLALVLQAGQTRVHIERPTLVVATDRDLPREISSRWLAGEVEAALAEQLGDVRISGPLGSRRDNTLLVGIDPESEQPAPAEQVQIDLRCFDGLCVFAVAREHAGARVNQQAMLFPDMPIARWRDIIRSTTLALYD